MDDRRTRWRRPVWPLRPIHGKIVCFSRFFRAFRTDRNNWSHNMAERKRVRRNTLERRCLGKAFKRLFVNSPKGVFKMLEKIKRV